MLYRAETQEAETQEAETQEAETQEAETQKTEKQEAGPEERPDRFDRLLRPWYEEPGAPNLFDIHWGIREELAEAGITPKVGLRATSREFEQNGAPAQLHTG